MKKVEIIKDKKIFTDLIHNGKFKRNQYYVIYFKKMETSNVSPRFGIAISNKLGNAVIRNKLKRQTKNIIDNNKNLFNNDYFYIIMLRKDINSIAYNKMNEKLIELMEDKK